MDLTDDRHPDEAGTNTVRVYRPIRRHDSTEG